MENTLHGLLILLVSMLIQLLTGGSTAGVPVARPLGEVASLLAGTPGNDRLPGASPVPVSRTPRSGPVVASLAPKVTDVTVAPVVAREPAVVRRPVVARRPVAKPERVSPRVVKPTVPKKENPPRIIPAKKNPPVSQPLSLSAGLSGTLQEAPTSSCDCSQWAKARGACSHSI